MKNQERLLRTMRTKSMNLTQLRTVWVQKESSTQDRVKVMTMKRQLCSDLILRLSRKWNQNQNLKLNLMLNLKQKLRLKEFQRKIF